MGMGGMSQHHTPGHHKHKNRLSDKDNKMKEEKDYKLNAVEEKFAAYALNWYDQAVDALDDAFFQEGKRAGSSVGPYWRLICKFALG